MTVMLMVVIMVLFQQCFNVDKQQSPDVMYDANYSGNDNSDDGAGSQDKDDLDDHYSGSENGAGLSWEHGQLHPGLFSHHEYDYG